VTADFDFGMQSATTAIGSRNRVEIVMSLWAQLEHLVTAAAHVAGHGEDLAMSHLSTDNRIAAAQAGWAGQSAEALVHCASRWAVNSTALVTRLGEHADGLHTAGLAFAAMETGNQQKLSS
jgi:uncharacterized protein YukE